MKMKCDIFLYVTALARLAVMTALAFTLTLQLLMNIPEPSGMFIFRMSCMMKFVIGQKLAKLWILLEK